MFIRNRIVHADAQNPGVQALIEIQISIVRLHLARSGRGEGGREEGHDQMMLPEVILVIVNQPILGRGQREPGRLIPDFQDRERRAGTVGIEIPPPKNHQGWKAKNEHPPFFGHSKSSFP